MRLLLDTHVFLWYIEGDEHLTPDVIDAIADGANEVYLSAASVWEAVIKYGLGKLPLPSEPAGYLSRQREAHGILSLPVDEGAFPFLAKLPLLHRDPFDRILIAQAHQHDLTLVTLDSAIRSYRVAVLPWAANAE